MTSVKDEGVAVDMMPQGRVRRPGAVLLAVTRPGRVRALREELAGRNRTVHVFSSQQAALALLQEATVDVVVLEQPGAGRSGLRFAREAARLAPLSARVAVLRNEDPRVARAFVNEAGVDYLLSPEAGPEALRQAVRTVWRRVRRSYRRLFRDEGQRSAVETLWHFNRALEKRVQERTRELTRTNRQLREALAQIEQKNRTLSVLNESLRIQAAVDPLTGLANRRSFMERIHEEWRRFQRYRRPFSVVLLDIDHFKQVNDTYGHECGDRVLYTLATIMQRNQRANDVPARYGGEEFVVLLPETPLESGFRVAEQLRRLVGEHRFECSDTELHLHISLGVAGAVEHGADTVEGLLNLADQAMYRAKRDGRDRAVVLQPGDPDSILHVSQPA